MCVNTFPVILNDNIKKLNYIKVRNQKIKRRELILQGI